MALHYTCTMHCSEHFLTINIICRYLDNNDERGNSVSLSIGPGNRPVQMQQGVCWWCTCVFYSWPRAHRSPNNEKMQTRCSNFHFLLQGKETTLNDRRYGKFGLTMPWLEFPLVLQFFTYSYWKIIKHELLFVSNHPRTLPFY